jgi:myo-inositol-1(or 4)-monophosphatase
VNELQEFKEFAIRLAKESAPIIKKYFRNKLFIENKPDQSPVTVADKEAEDTMRGIISRNYPGHGIIGEEFGTINPDAEYVWVLDPIDGTKSFICGTVCFGTLIGFLKNGEPILGVFNQPILNELLIGDNKIAEINGRKTSVRKCSKLSEAVLLTTDHVNITKYKRAERFKDLISKVKLYRNWGDCYGYYLLATGFADIMIDPIMSPWDLIPLIPIIRGADGVITDYQGNNALNGNSIIAASPGIHQEVIMLLNG